MSKKRSPNFTELEKKTLAEEYIKNMHITIGKLYPILTVKHKEEAWAKIVEAVNAVAPSHRGLPSIKAKWKEMKRETKLRLEINNKEMLKADGGAAAVELLFTVDKLAETGIDVASTEGMGGMDRLKEGEQILFDGTLAIVDGAFNSVRVLHSEPELQAGQSVHEELMALICKSPASALRTQATQHDEPSASESSAAGNEPGDPLEDVLEPPKKRACKRRRVEDVKAAVVGNHEALNSKIDDLVSELKHGNNLAEKYFQLKQEKIREEAARHKETVDVQKQISDSLKYLVSRLNPRKDC